MTRKERYRRLFEHGCIACRLFCGPWAYRQPQFHHIVNQSYRKHQGGDRCTIPLCPWHHQGKNDDGFTGLEMQTRYGPSLALDAKYFHALFGSDDHLLEMVDKEIGAPPRD